MKINHFTSLLKKFIRKYQIINEVQGFNESGKKVYDLGRPTYPSESIKFLLKHLPFKKPSSIAEIGCGIIFLKIKVQEYQQN